MNAIKLFSSTAHQSLSNQSQWRTLKTATTPLLFHFTQPLQIEPMKKKKRVNPKLIAEREDKKVRNLEKQIRKITLKGKILKPVEEIEGDRDVLKTAAKRYRRPVILSEEEGERRASVMKCWQRYKFSQWVAEERALKTLLGCRSEALCELRKESEELYQQAIQLDEKFIPFERMGPVDTPPIKEHMSPEGDYIDTTKRYDKR